MVRWLGLAVVTDEAVSRRATVRYSFSLSLSLSSILSGADQNADNTDNGTEGGTAAQPLVPGLFCSCRKGFVGASCGQADKRRNHFHGNAAGDKACLNR